MDLAATLDDLGFDRQGLVDAAMLCGTDFNEGVRGIGPKTAVKAVREHGDLWGRPRRAGRRIPNAEGDPRAVHGPASDGRGRGHGGEPDVDAAREYVVDEWGVAADEVERGFERIAESQVQTGARPVDVRRPEDRREHTFYFPRRQKGDVHVSWTALRPRIPPVTSRRVGSDTGGVKRSHAGERTDRDDPDQ